jgi:hypothetical protein
MFNIVLLLLLFAIDKHSYYKHNSLQGSYTHWYEKNIKKCSNPIDFLTIELTIVLYTTNFLSTDYIILIALHSSSLNRISQLISNEFF